MLIGDYSLLGLGRNFTPTSAFFYTAILLIVPLVLALHLNRPNVNIKLQKTIEISPICENRVPV